MLSQFSSLTSYSQILILLLLFLTAMLYSSVGHGGASSYLAILSFLSISPNEMSTTALILNLVVSGIAFFLFYRAGHFSLQMSWPFIIGSIPASFIGGMIQIDEKSYFLLLALVLILAAIRLLMPEIREQRLESRGKKRDLLFHYWIPAGALIGLLSGIIGIGGGVFLSPLIVLMKWADLKTTSATAAFFILLNSIGGLAGRYVQGTIEIGNLLPYILVSTLGGFLGSYYGSKKFPQAALSRILAIVLILAAIKLILKA